MSDAAPDARQPAAAGRGPLVYLTRPVPEPYAAQLAARCAVRVWREGPWPTRAQLLRDVADVEGIFAAMGVEPIDAEVIAAAPRLRVISNNAVGFNNVDLEAATARGIVVATTPGATDEALAEMAFALMLGLAHRIPEMDRLVRAGGWRGWGLMEGLGRDVNHATLGIVGLGGSGRILARRARGFDMQVLYTSRTRRPEAERALGLEWVSLHDLLRRSDFVSLHLPLNETTRGLLGEAELRLMQPTAYLVNAARWAIVQRAAIERALREGWIAGAAFDVYEVEPLPPDDPVLTLPNTILTPHRASATLDCRARQTGAAVANLLAGLEGRPVVGCVNAAGLARRAAEGPGPG